MKKNRNKNNEKDIVKKIVFVRDIIVSFNGFCYVLNSLDNK